MAGPNAKPREERGKTLQQRAIGKDKFDQADANLDPLEQLIAKEEGRSPGGRSNSQPEEAPAGILANHPELSHAVSCTHKSGLAKTGFNLRAVAEVLAAEGMDPTAELVAIMKKVDAQGRPAIGDDVKTRVMLELLKFVQPTLKAVEVRIDPTESMTDDQLNARIASLVAKDAARRG